MRKTFEELAVEVLKLHLEVQKTKNTTSTAVDFNPDFDYDVNSLCSITNSVVNIANQLATNHRERMLQYDKENFDKEVEKMLSTDNKDVQ